jgi:prophage antirepressor-like protein
LPFNMSSESQLIEKVFAGNIVNEIVINGERHWVANDFASPLGYKGRRGLQKILRNLDADEVFKTHIQSKGGSQLTTVLTHAGVLNLMLVCPKAYKKNTVAWNFRRWVTHELVPNELSKLQAQIDRLTVNAEYRASEYTKLAGMFEEKREEALELQDELHDAQTEAVELQEQNENLADDNDDLIALETRRYYKFARRQPAFAQRYPGNAYFTPAKRIRIRYCSPQDHIEWHGPVGHKVPYVIEGHEDAVRALLIQHM